MATITDKRAINATLSTTTVDRAQLLQFWDQIEVTNAHATEPLYISDDGVTNPTAGGEGFVFIPAGQTKILKARTLSNSVADGSAVICHEIRVLGNGNIYQICGLQSSFA